MTYGWLGFEELLETTKELGLDSDMMSIALSATDVEVARTVLQQLKGKRGDPYFVEAFACAILDTAVAQQSHNVQPICALLLEVGEADTAAIAELAKLGNQEALGLIRQALNANWSELRDIAASAVIEAQYHGQVTDALQDEAESVRQMAAQQLERQENTAKLTQALNNDSAPVRRIAGWYMGRKKVVEAVKPLMQRLKVETDTEALRAVIWSLGVLRDAQAVSVLEGFIEHPDGLVGTAARIALSKIAKGAE